MGGHDLATIDRYTRGLAAELRGPRRLRDDMVAEARDSLLDAAEAHVDAGATPSEAARRAVDEFGCYRLIVPAYQAELAAAQGRRTVSVLVLALPLLHLLAPLMWWRCPWVDERPVPGYYLLTSNFDYLSLGASALAAVLLLGFGWGSRYVRDSVRYARLVGVGTLGFLAVHGATGAVVFGLSIYQWPAASTWPPMLVGMAVNGVAFGYAAFTAWRCVLASRLGLGSADGRARQQH